MQDIKVKNPEQIVDAWFRTIAMQVLDEQGVDKDRNIAILILVRLTKTKVK